MTFCYEILENKIYLRAKLGQNADSNMGNTKKLALSC